MGKIKDWIFAPEEDEPEDEEFHEEIDVDPKTSMFEKAHSARTTDAVKKFGTTKDSQLVLFEPRAYSETQDIATFLKQKKAAVVNLHRLQKEQSKRVVDFLSGVIFAIDGDIQQIGPKIFLLLLMEPSLWMIVMKQWKDRKKQYASFFLFYGFLISSF